MHEAFCTVVERAAGAILPQPVILPVREAAIPEERPEVVQFLTSLHIYAKQYLTNGQLVLHEDQDNSSAFLIGNPAIYANDGLSPEEFTTTIQDNEIHDTRRTPAWRIVHQDPTAQDESVDGLHTACVTTLYTDGHVEVRQFILGVDYKNSWQELFSPNQVNGGNLLPLSEDSQRAITQHIHQELSKDIRAIKSPVIQRTLDFSRALTKLALEGIRQQDLESDASNAIDAFLSKTISSRQEVKDMIRFDAPSEKTEGMQIAGYMGAFTDPITGAKGLRIAVKGNNNDRYIVEITDTAAPRLVKINVQTPLFELVRRGTPLLDAQDLPLTDILFGELYEHLNSQISLLHNQKPDAKVDSLLYQCFRRLTMTNILGEAKYLPKVLPREADLIHERRIISSSFVDYASGPNQDTLFCMTDNMIALAVQPHNYGTMMVIIYNRITGDVQVGVGGNIAQFVNENDIDNQARFVKGLEVFFTGREPITWDDTETAYAVLSQMEILYASGLTKSDATIQQAIDAWKSARIQRDMHNLAGTLVKRDLAITDKPKTYEIPPSGSMAGTAAEISLGNADIPIKLIIRSRFPLDILTNDRLQIDSEDPRFLRPTLLTLEINNIRFVFNERSECVACYFILPNSDNMLSRVNAGDLQMIVDSIAAALRRDGYYAPANILKPKNREDMPDNATGPVEEEQWVLETAINNY